MLFEATKCGVICCSSGRKRIHTACELELNKAIFKIILVLGCINRSMVSRRREGIVSVQPKSGARVSKPHCTKRVENPGWVPGKLAVMAKRSETIWGAESSEGLGQVSRKKKRLKIAICLSLEAVVGHEKAFAGTMECVTYRQHSAADESLLLSSRKHFISPIIRVC